MTTLADVHDAFRAWLTLPSEGELDPVELALAPVAANRMDGDPLWLFLVAPPSGGKTETLRALDDVPEVFALSKLTANTFASGFEKRGVETSLLPRLDGKVMVLKDFGSVLSMYREARAEVLGQLREIYDGSYSARWGNGKEFRWMGKVGLLAGVTDVIDREHALHASLGERFLMYRLPATDPLAAAHRAAAQRAHESGRRAELRQLVADLLAGVPVSTPPPIPRSILDGLAALAVFAAHARSPILFDARGEIELIPRPEGPGRLVKQLAVLAQALAAVRGEPEVLPATYRTILKVAQDCVPAPRGAVLEVLLSADPDHDPPTTTAIAEATTYPTTTCRRYLQELTALQLVERQAEGPGKPDRWVPAERLLDLFGQAHAPCGDLSSSVRESKR